MTERKPASESVDSFVERQIREGQERGAFDGLRGAGKPLPGIDRGGDDEMWWVRRKLSDEQLLALPPALKARYERDQALLAIQAATTETAVRAIVADVNTKILRINMTAHTGPPTDTMPLDPERTVARWRADPSTREVTVTATTPPPTPLSRRERLRRRLRRGSGGAQGRLG